MCEHTYGIAEMQWVTEEQGFKPCPIRARWLCSPAKFECYEEHLWSLCVSLDYFIYPGDTVTVPVTTLVEEVADELLFIGSKFVFTLDGTRPFAFGRVVAVERVSDEEHRRRARADRML